MSAGSVSLESALRTCKVNTAWATRIESDRFFNSNNLVCPVWNGMDGTGRQVCKDSYYHKSAGCNSATDRVNVENDVSRPKYAEYITLSANGIAGDIYGQTDAYKNSQLRHRELDDINKITGNFGKQFGSAIQTTCGYHSYTKHDDHHGGSGNPHGGSGNPHGGSGHGGSGNPHGGSGNPHRGSGHNSVAQNNQNAREAHSMGMAYNAQHNRSQSGF
jgi:hypothetical protein